MCGIAGYVSRTPIESSVLEGMSEIIRYRGPDGGGYALFSKSSVPASTFSDMSCAEIGFAHRRLSIVDLSSLGHQPMSYDDGRYWITYNGEIYNYLELREDLTALGHVFKSQSDTEVILAAYAQWGEDCLSRFNGMWAFAIHDRTKGSVFLSRDRFGVKPMYYWISPQGIFYFASEIKQFTVLPGWNAKLNAQRSYDFLIWGLCDHTEETMFAGVYQLRPGHHIEIGADTSFLPLSSMPSVRWYDLKDKPYTGSFKQAAKDFEALLEDSVRLRLRADVPVGSCLSGGLDSSSLVCLLNRQLGDDARQKTFSAVSDVKKYNELPWIEEVVRTAKVEDHYVSPSLDSLFSLSDKITWHQDEPFGSTSVYAQWSVFELAGKTDVIVMLDGQGADEQLGGYHMFFAPLFFGLLKSGRFVELWREMRAIKKLHGHSIAYSIMHILHMMLPAFLKNPLKKMNGRSNISPDWLDTQRLGAKKVDPHKMLGSYTDSIKKLCKAQLMASNLQALLHWEDRNSMAHSIESRVPFLDYRLVEFSMGLPDDYKISGGKTKLILREAMSGILPDKIRDRMDKLGFVTPEEVWIRERSTNLFKEKLQEALDTLDGIITPEIMNYFDEVVAGKKPFNFTLWRIINFSQWVRVFNVQIKA